MRCMRDAVGSRWVSSISMFVALALVASLASGDTALDDFTTIPVEGSVTFGVAWDGQAIWGSDGNGDVSRIDPVTGTILHQFTAPDTGDPEGRDMAWNSADNALWYGSWSTDKIYLLDPASGSVMRQFAAPGNGPQGLAFDGTHLWVSDEYRSSIWKVNPQNGAVLQEIPSAAHAHGTYSSGLAWGNDVLYEIGHFWSGARGTMWELNPVSGAIIETYSLPAAVEGQNGYHGLAFDGRYFWCIGHEKQARLYRIDSGGGGISGCVVVEGISLPNATVTLKLKGSKKQKTKTDADGHYIFPDADTSKKGEIVIKLPGSK